MSASPLSGLSDGQIQREPGNPIPYAEERRWTPAPPRVLMSGGQWGPDATDADRALLSARLAPVAYREPAKRKQWAPQAAPLRSHPGGRPCIHSRDLIPQIEQLRSEGVSWRMIGERLGIPGQAARGKVQARDKSAKRKSA